MASIRLLFQIAVQYDLLIHHIDVKSSYINTPLDYEIYVEPLKALTVRMGIMFGNLKNPLQKNIPYLSNYTKFRPVTCGPLHVHSKCPQSNINHLIMD